ACGWVYCGPHTATASMTSPIGTSIKRREDERLVTGRGRYLDDLRLPGILHAAIVRSPHAHARVARIDAAPARALPGVIAVLTGADIPECTGGAVPPLVPSTSIRPYRHPALAAGLVRAVGEAVAVVVADDAARAAACPAAVVVAYEPLAVAATVDAAQAVRAPRVFDEWPDNVAGLTAGDVGDIERGFSEAQEVVEIELAVPRVAPLPIEPRGVLAVPQAADGRFTVWTASQVPYSVRTAVAGALGMGEESIRVIAPDVGGGFGGKGHVYPEDVLIPAVARRLGRPGKGGGPRTQHFPPTPRDPDERPPLRP